MRAPSTDELEAVAADIRRSGVRFGAPRILHRGGTLVVGDGNLVARIAATDTAEAEEIIGRALALGANRAPVLEPAHPRPVATRLGVATVWPQGRPAPDVVRNLGRTLAALHAVDGIVLAVRDDTREDLRRRLRGLTAAGVDERALARLMHIAARLPEEPSWAGTAGRLVHGDAHTGNLIWHEGRVLLLDTSTTGNGDTLADLVPAWYSARRGKRGWNVWEEFRDGYGTGANELARWEHLDEALLERELTTTIFLAEQWQTQPWVRDEIENRLATWDDPDDGERWETGD